MSLESDNLSSTASVRLQKLSHVPLTKDLQAALDQSRTTTSAVIELPWKASASPATYVIKVSCEDGVDEANWVLYKGETIDAAVLWSFDSNDLSLIESLIAAECDGASSFNLNVSDTPINVDETERARKEAERQNQIQSGQYRPNLPKGVELDQAMLKEASISLIDPLSGMIQEKYFQYFLCKEFDRYQCIQDPFAVVMVRIRVDYGDGKIGFLPERAAQETLKRFKQALRAIDILAQYQENKMAILLPGGTANSGVQCVQSLEKELADEPLQPGLDVHQIRFSAGIASVPETCKSKEVVLAAALEALKQSSQSTSSLVVFPSAQ